MIPNRRDWPHPGWRQWAWPLLFPPARALFLFLGPARIEGLSNLPRSGPYILVSNHISGWDPPWIEFVTGRAIRWMAKRELFAIPLLGLFLRFIGCFPVHRGAVDRRALAAGLRVLEEGLPLGLFPEGHRSEDGTLLRARAGVGYFAQRTGAPLVPIGVSGSDRAIIGRFWRTDTVIRIGAPFQVTELPESQGGDQQAISDAIMRRIATLLPAERHGFYKE